MQRLSRTLQGEKQLISARASDEAPILHPRFLNSGWRHAGVVALRAEGAFFACANGRPSEFPAIPRAGRRMFFAGGCDSCHSTPEQPDPLRLGGGLELKTPFGSFYPPNISSDPVDGIGGWREVDLANALLSGVSPEGRHYYPAFPYTSYQRMNPSDVADLIAFLRTLPPVQGRPPEHRLIFPFSIRRALGIWKLLYFDKAGLAPDLNRSAEWNLGRYLVEGPGHCGECHTPRNLLGAMKPSLHLAGAPVLDGKGNAPNLTGAQSRRLDECRRRRGIDQRIYSGGGCPWRGDDERGAKPGAIAAIRSRSDCRLSQKPTPDRRAFSSQAVRLNKGQPRQPHSRNSRWHSPRKPRNSTEGCFFNVDHP